MFDMISYFMHDEIEFCFILHLRPWFHVNLLPANRIPKRHMYIYIYIHVFA